MHYLVKCKIIVGLSFILFSLIPSSDSYMIMITRSGFEVEDQLPLSTTTKFDSTTTAKISSQILNILQGQCIPQPQVKKIATTIATTKTTARKPVTTTKKAITTTKNC